MKKLVIVMIVGSVLMAAATPSSAQGVPVPSSRAVAEALARSESPVLARAQIGSSQSMPSELAEGSPSSKALMWAGAGLFVGGMTAGIYGFLNNSNGKFPAFGEAEATNTRIGAAGLTTAFAGGALMYFGYRLSRHAPDVELTAERFAVSKQVTW